MELAQLEGRHQRLLRELLAVDAQQPRHDGRVRRLKEDLCAIEREIASLCNPVGAMPAPPRPPAHGHDPAHPSL